MLQIIGRGKGAKLRIIPASSKGIRGSSNIANPAPNTTEWTEISPGVWQCTGLNIGAATTLFLAQEADGLVIGQAYLLSATITGTADILIRSGSTTIDTNWDGSPKIFIPGNGNFNIFQRAGGYTIQSIVIREAVIIATGVTSISEVGSAVAESQDAVAALGVESASEVGLAPMAGVAALGVESASEVGSATVASIDAPAATGVESASEVATVTADTTAPTMTGDTYTEGTFTFAATISEPATMHYLVSAIEPTTVDDIVLGTGYFKTTVEVVAGVNNVYLELSTVPAGAHWFSALPVDAFNNADFAEAHIAQYAFPGGYTATGIESASEVGSAAVSSIDATAASGVESASEVATAPLPTISATATGVESASEVGAAEVDSVDAPAATGVESASEIGTASQVTGTTRRALEISGGTGTADGMEYAAGTPNISEFTWSGWVYIPTGHATSRSIFAGPSGTVQIWTGVTNSGVLNARGNGTTGAATSGSAYSLDTWFHLHVMFGTNWDGTTDLKMYINGSIATSTSASPMSSTAMNGTWYLMQDNSPLEGITGLRMFDVAMFGSHIDIADANYSGGSWTDFGSTTGIVCRLDGQTSGDATQDSSGNANHWSQSSGGGTTVTSESSLPSGANP